LTLALTLGLVQLLAVFILFTPLSAAPAPPLIWHPADSGLPANVEALAVAPTTLYAGTWGEGVYRSTDHGASWQPANTGITLPLHIQGGLMVNPVTPTQVFAGDYYGDGLYRSNNGAISWTLVLSDTAVRAVAVHPLSPTVVLAGDREEGLYRSDDGGTTWDAVPTTVGLDVRALAGYDVLASSDAGLTWASVASFTSTVQTLAVHPTTSTLLYAGTFNHGLHRSDDGGATWERLTNGIPVDAWVTSLSIHAGPPETLYAGMWDGQVYPSFDGGDSWEGLGYLGHVYAVLAHPEAPTVVYAGTSNNGLFRGSTLDHLTMEPVSDPQYVHRPFTVTLTARDALGFPLTGDDTVVQSARDPRLAATLSSSGYAGTAVLTSTVDAFTPQSVTLVDGIGETQVTFTEEIDDAVLMATLPEGPETSSDPFDVRWYAQIYLPIVAHEE
jgi:hypothetical protein